MFFVSHFVGENRTCEPLNASPWATRYYRSSLSVAITLLMSYHWLVTRYSITFAQISGPGVQWTTQFANLFANCIMSSTPLPFINLHFIFHYSPLHLSLPSTLLFITLHHTFHYPPLYLPLPSTLHLITLLFPFHCLPLFLSLSLFPFPPSFLLPYLLSSLSLFFPFSFSLLYVLRTFPDLPLLFPFSSISLPSAPSPPIAGHVWRVCVAGDMCVCVVYNLGNRFPHI